MAISHGKRLGKCSRLMKASGLTALLLTKQFGHQMGAVSCHDSLRLRVRMRQHAHHGLRQESVLQADGPLVYSEPGEMMGYGVDHAHLILEPRDMVERGQPLHVLDVGLRHAQRHLNFLGDHGVGAEAAVPGEIEHVGRRSVKEPEEVDRIQAAAAVASAGMGKAVGAVRAGITESQVAAEAEYAMRQNGAEEFWRTYVSSGPPVERQREPR